MDNEAKRIAEGLTEAQSAAVRGKFAWQSPWDQESGEAVLYQLGIWNPRPKWGQSAITPLGLRVRTYLEQKQ